MSPVSRRDFCRRAAKAALTLSIASPLAELLGCGSSYVNPPLDSYDAIIIGGGTAGSIVAAKLRLATGGRKRILIIDAGGPLSAASGGAARPPWLSAGRNDLSIFDVPGEYSQVAFMPLGVPYQLSEVPFTFQGIGLGGNSMYNGMLFQTNPPEVFDRSWPSGWQWADMAPYFERVRARVPVTNTPSTDGIPQNTAPAEIIHPLYAANGWSEADTSRPYPGRGVYSRPYVAADAGRRAGPISGYFAEVMPDGAPLSNLEILPCSKVTHIDFNDNGETVAVHFNQRTGLIQSDQGTAGTVRLNGGGLMIMAAGALITPKLLLVSGVGPRGRESEIFLGQSRAPFAIDNPLVGVGVYDHEMTNVVYGYSGAVPYRVYDYGDYTANQADLQQYLAGGRGPYGQYQPVSILNYGLDSDLPNVEIFLNPNGVGTPGGPYYVNNTIAAYCMLLNPKARGLITLDASGKVQQPAIYLPNTADGAADTTLMVQAVFDMLRLFARESALRIVFGPGGASHPHLNPNSLADVRRYVTAPSPVDGVYYNRMTINHFGGTVALTDGEGGVDPATLIVRGTANVAVVDASLIPTIVPAHPVGTIMAMADRAGDILAAQIS
jgi:choline dehydrogenase-like flavoprotein